MVREVHFAWDGDNGVETTLVRAADRRMTETHDWDLGEFADAIPLATEPQAAETETNLDEPAETPAQVETERRKRRRRSDGPKRHLAGANWLAYMPSPRKPDADVDGDGKKKGPERADADR